MSPERRAWSIRRKALLMGEMRGQSCIRQALGIADVLAACYFHALDYRPADPDWAVSAQRGGGIFGGAALFRREGGHSRADQGDGAGARP